jgi:hypothetical protein
MTSVFGTDSAYYGIADQHLYLNLTDEKKDGAYYSQIMSIGGSDEDITAYTEKYNSKWNPSIFKAIKNYDKDCQNSTYTPILKDERKTTIYSVLKQIPSLKECSKLVDESYFYNTLSDQGLHKYTFFAFENQGLEVANSFLQKYNFETYAIRELLKCNTLYYPLNPSHIVKRKLKLKTLSEHNQLHADGRGKELVIYIPNTTLNYYRMPTQDIVLRIKGYIETDNGWLYIIEAPVIPQIIV